MLFVIFQNAVFQDAQHVMRVTKTFKLAQKFSEMWVNGVNKGQAFAGGQAYMIEVGKELNTIGEAWSLPGQVALEEGS